LGARKILMLLQAGDTKWDTKEYKYQGLIKNLTKNDLGIVKALDFIGEGELSAIGIIRQHADRVNQYESRELAKDFYESVMYCYCMINYEEIRHGFILKELASLAKRNESFIDNVEESFLHELIFETKDIYKNPYESLMSLLIGEITNIELYASVESQIQNKELKNIINKIKVDEQRHKDAWFKIIKNMINSNSTHYKKFLDAFNNIHYVHQAEVSNYFQKGADSVERFFTPSVTTFIADEKYNLMTKIFGKDTINKKQMIHEQILHIHKILKQ